MKRHLPIKPPVIPAIALGAFYLLVFIMTKYFTQSYLDLLAAITSSAVFGIIYYLLHSVVRSMVISE